MPWPRAQTEQGHIQGAHSLPQLRTATNKATGRRRRAAPPAPEYGDHAAAAQRTAEALGFDGFSASPLSYTRCFTSVRRPQWRATVS